MSYFWTIEPQPGVEITEQELAEAGVGQRFETQSEAERWLTEFFADVLDLGAGRASLFEEERLVYGPMPLTS